MHLLGETLSQDQQNQLLGGTQFQGPDAQIRALATISGSQHRLTNLWRTAAPLLSHRGAYREKGCLAGATRRAAASRAGSYTRTQEGPALSLRLVSATPSADRSTEKIGTLGPLLI